MRRPILTNIDGKSYTFRELSQKYHLNLATLKGRYKRGDRQYALVRPTKPYRNRRVQEVTIYGIPYTFDELSRIFHLTKSTLY